MALLAYPAVLFFLADTTDPLIMACLFAAIAGPRLLLAKHLSMRTVALGLSAVVVLCIVTAIAQNVVAIKLYPAALSATAAIWCGYTLLTPPTAIERLLIVISRSTDGLPKPVRERIPLADTTDTATNMIEPSKAQRAYMRGLTGVWFGFFAINTGIALFTATHQSTGGWALYNGVISYVLVAVIFLLEILYRPFYQRRHQSADTAPNSDVA